MSEIIVEKLRHIYSAGTPFEVAAIEDIDLVIPQGQLVAVIGHTGSGKSTFIQHLNALLSPSSGKVSCGGKDINENKLSRKAVKSQVGLVFQYPEYQLFEETVYKDISFGPQNMGLDQKEVDRRVRAAAYFVGLRDDQLEKSPFELSGGQKRRVAIAGVIAMEPEVLILDEPTAGLDPEGVESILGNIRDYHRAHNATIILVSHSMEEMARTVDRLVVVNDGKLPFQGTPREVFQHGDELERMGLGVPQLTRVFHRLRALGVDIDPSVYTLEQAKGAVLDALAKRDKAFEKGVE